jgi:hypothetical protein
MHSTILLRAGARPATRVGSGLAVRLALASIVGALLLGGGTVSPELRIRQAAGPYAFRLLDWELGRLGERAGRIGAGLIGRSPEPDAAGRQAVGEYFRAAPEAREPRRAPAEAAIEQALTAVLRSDGLAVAMPLAAEGSVVFPPVSFSFVSPPQVLIVAPRDRIAVSQAELLRPDLARDQAVALEAAVDNRGVSSLVVRIGGLATYPAMVVQGNRPLDALAGVAHEWIHGYFFFHPLGRAYWSSQAARTINETAAELAGRELGERLARELGLAEPAARTPAAEQPRPADRDFRAIMRATRIEVDRLLAAGRIDEAEAYMNDRRDELAAAGYDVRKLNQAYFAFYGSYGDAAAGSSPIPGRLRRLREASPSLGDFLRRVAHLTNGDDLARAVGDA